MPHMSPGETVAAAVQRTLHDSVVLEGVGLHSGSHCRVKIRPAPADTGIVLEVASERSSVCIPAAVTWAVRGERCTALEREGVRVATVEHLLAALSESGVDNAHVEVAGHECPALDGSARCYVEAIEGAGIRSLEASRREQVLRQCVWVAEGDSWLVASPALERRVTVGTDYPELGRQVVDFELEPGVFAREIAPARTPAFMQELGALIGQGLGQGGSLDNVVVVTGNGTLRDPRFADEVARHKALDLLGDLSLAGRVRAHIWGIRPGHAANLELARKLAAAVNRP
jgi:UDP-3-O-[3-hydroxymyristoyl] N-acetylglucosamine deacetylase